MPDEEKKKTEPVAPVKTPEKAPSKIVNSEEAGKEIKKATTRPVKRVVESAPQVAEAKEEVKIKPKEAAPEPAETEEKVEIVESEEAAPEIVDAEEEAIEIVEPAKKKKEKKAKKAEKEDEEDEEEEEEKYKVKPKPELGADEKHSLSLRAVKRSKKPKFRRQEWFRYGRLGESWRKPRGLHSKTRRNYLYRAPKVSKGYRGPKMVRGRHSSGFEDILIYSPKELEGLDPKKQAVRIGHTVGTRKRIEIKEKADELGIRILNWGS